MNLREYQQKAVEWAKTNSFGLIIARLKGIDIRQHGSGNIGATNVLRVVGKKYGITCLLLDALKGFIPVAIAINLIQISGRPVQIPLAFLDGWALKFPAEEAMKFQVFQILTALLAILGHNYSPWVGFKGGKGIATSAGVLLALMPFGVILLIAQDTTPGQEFFCWALKTHGGNDDLHRDSCHALYKSPGTTGWNSIAVFPRTTKQFYGQVVLHGYSGNRFGGLPSAFGSSIHATATSCAAASSWATTTSLFRPRACSIPRLRRSSCRSHCSLARPASAAPAPISAR
jgi:acyl-phosphate glycerol 3-phosphate acyltransferase